MNEHLKNEPDLGRPSKSVKEPTAVELAVNAFLVLTAAELPQFHKLLIDRGVVFSIGITTPTAPPASDGYAGLF
jgi:hypothetical protein